MNLLIKNRLAYFALSTLLATQAGIAFGQTVAPSTYSSAIQVQGELEGTEFNDWAGIPIAFSDPQDNPGEFEGRPYIDIANIQVANNSEYLFIKSSFHNTSSVGIFISFDFDQNKATGFDLFGAGLIGSELGYQNDFPFQQDTGAFNSGFPITGGPFGNGGALLYPFFDQDGADKEWAIPLDMMFGDSVESPVFTPAFSSMSFDFMLWTDQGAGDIIDQTISYTIASAPELQGDYNDDGTVDAADYTVWRDSLNSIGVGLAADGNNDEVVNQEDYAIWVANFGTSSSTSSVTSVPEPTSLCLMGLILVGSSAAARKQRS